MAEEILGFCAFSMRIYKYLSHWYHFSLRGLAWENSLRLFGALRSVMNSGHLRREARSRGLNCCDNLEIFGKSVDKSLSCVYNQKKEFI